MELGQLIELLKKKLEDLRKNASIRDFDGGTFRAWAQDVETILIRGLGDRSTRLLAHFYRAIRGLPMPDNLIDPGYQEPIYRERFENKLPEVEAVLESIIWELEMFGLPDAHIETEIGREKPKVFIAHGGLSPALFRVRDFLSILGAEPVIVEDLPSMGMAVDDKVEYYLGQADCAIILATSDEGKPTARQNVIHEIGLAQSKFPNRIVYLLEDGVEFPSNIHPRVWERFNQDNMENVFMRIATELGAFGILKAVKPRE